jgi:hypothetical protein
MSKQVTKPIPTPHLDKYLAMKNQMRVLFKQPQINLGMRNRKETAEEIFKMLECDLSPENLHCDGERPPAQAYALEAMYNKAWKELEKAVGVKREPVI